MTSDTILPKRILVVDDEPPVRDALRMLFECDGHQVETASGGNEALAKFSPGKYDVVTTDMRMPGMTGDQLADAIKAQVPQQPIIMISANETTHYAAVDCLIPKPFTMATLRKALAAVLEVSPAEHK